MTRVDLFSLARLHRSPGFLPYGLSREGVLYQYYASGRVLFADDAASSSTFEIQPKMVSNCPGPMTVGSISGDMVNPPSPRDTLLPMVFPSFDVTHDRKRSCIDDAPVRSVEVGVAVTFGASASRFALWSRDFVSGVALKESGPRSTAVDSADFDFVC